MKIATLFAHIGIDGNERADALAKEATENPTIEFELPVPFSYVKEVFYQLGRLFGMHMTRNTIPINSFQKYLDNLISFPHQPQNSSLGTDPVNNT